MFKKFVYIALCAVMLILLCGCNSFLEDEYVSDAPHKASSDQGSQPNIKTLTASSYTSLCNALCELVDSHAENGVIKFDSYDGDLEADLSAACIYVSNDTPLGAYAVKHINSNLNKIVSYYEADISITYEKTVSEIAQIKEFTGETDIEAELLPAISDYSSCLTLHAAENSLDSARITEALSSLYYSAPEDILYLPELTVNNYPENGSEQIVEILFKYPFSAAILRERSAALTQRADEIIAEMDEQTGDAAVEYLCATLDRIVEFSQDAETDDYNRWMSIYTAYGPLVLGKAAPEGYAMAMKLLCDKIDIECVVVRGRLNNISHAWNIVRLENGSCYHLDVSRYDGAVALRNDDELSTEQYWWDVSLYPACDGEPLNNISEEPDAPDSETAA